MTWTPERTALLLEMRARGLTHDVIARELGVTRSAVSGKCDRIDGYRRRDSGYRTDYRVARHKLTSRSSKSWDEKMFEPYAIRKQRLAQERANVAP